MSKQVTRYKCDFCRRERATIAGIEKHEKECVHNPNGFNCYLCALSYHGEWEVSEYESYNAVPLCIWYEEPLHKNGNIAGKCEYFHRTDKMYYTRTDEDARKFLQELEENEGE